MSEKQIPEIIAINAIGTSGAFWEYDYGGRSVDVEVLIQFNSPADAGSVVVEEAPSMAYAGTYLNLATIAFVAAGRVHSVVIQGRPIRVLKVRLPGLIGNNGTVTARVYTGL